MSRRDDIQKELEAIGRRNGGLVSPQAVVEFAADPTTALHAQFEWDDGAAAHAYRVWQARRLIKCFVVVLAPDTEPVQVWASLPADRKTDGGYRLTVDVLSQADQRKQLLAAALAELERVRQRYDHLTELAEVFKAVRRVRRAARKVAV